jgi:thiamine biosynthesis lipoprotein
MPAATRTRREVRARLMGSNAHVVIEGAAGPAPEDAIARLRELERTWSRFRPDSELNRLNAARSAPCVVSSDLARAIERACAAWEATGGAFDPTVDVAVLGYDRDFATLPRVARARPARPAPGCRAIRREAGGRVVTLPPGTRLDLGGIGKGLAADVVAEEAVAAGAEGVVVNVGGDVRAHGEPPDGRGWCVGLDLDPGPGPAGDRALTVTLAAGAVATSSRLRRRWLSEAGDQHHIVEPASGRSGRTGYATVAIVTAEAWWAEVVAKQVFLAGAAAGPPAGTTGAARTDDGRIVTFPGLEAFR